jgi:thiol-disulfide isomerase/thioredoxin
MPRQMSWPRILAPALGLAALLVLAGCSLQQNIADQATGDAAAGQTAAPPLAGTTTTGAQVSYSMRGGVTAIDFWGSWCGPCRAEQPALDRLASAYMGRGVRFVGVDMEDDSASANAYRADFGVPYPSLEDATGAIAAAYDVSAPPTLIVVDRGGTITGRFLGTLVGAQSALDRALG